MAKEKRMLSIEEMSSLYIKAKEAVKAYDADIKLGTQIKEYLVNNDLKSFDTEVGTVKMTVIPKTEMNEEKAIEILKTTLKPEQLNMVVVSKPVIDEQALEALIYDGVLKADVLAPALEQKEPTYRITYTAR